MASKKGWRLQVRVHPHSFSFMFGCRIEINTHVVGWPSISLWLHFWHRAYRFWLYKMGKD